MSCSIVPCSTSLLPCAPFAEPILQEVQENELAYAEADRLLRFLRYFNHICERDLPRTSLLREFLGGGSFGCNFNEK